MTQLAYDDFTRANNADAGTAWDENTGESGPSGFDISSNRAVPSALANDSSETNNTVTWPDDQWSEVRFFATVADGAGAGSGPCCREATGATVTYYRAVGNASGYELIRRVAGAFVSLSTGTGTTFAGNDTLRLEVRTNGANCDWTLKKNGTTFASGTDTSPIASGRAAIGHSSTSTTATIAAWSGGDFIVVPGDGGGGFDDRIRVRHSVNLGNGTGTGTCRAHWPDDALDGKRRDQVADNHSRAL